MNNETSTPKPTGSRQPESGSGLSCADLFSVARKCGDIVTEGHPDDEDLWVPIQQADQKLAEARQLCRDLWDLAASCATMQDMDTRKLLDSMPEWIHSENVKGHAPLTGSAAGEHGKESES